MRCIYSRFSLIRSTEVYIRERERDGDRETERQRDRETERQRQRQRTFRVYMQLYMRRLARKRDIIKFILLGLCLFLRSSA